jgi:hypothetical protein
VHAAQSKPAAASKALAQARPRGRWIALLLYGLGCLGAAWHDASAGHAVCEHGEFVHAAGVHGIGVHAAGAENARGDAHRDHGDEPALAAPPSSSVEEHEHCLAWSPAKRPAGPAHIPSPAVPLAVVLAQRGAERTTLEALFPLFLLAPGRSPPAA